jgi:translation initiation factor IF-2
MADEQDRRDSGDPRGKDGVSRPPGFDADLADGERSADADSAPTWPTAKPSWATDGRAGLRLAPAARRRHGRSWLAARARSRSAGPARSLYWQGPFGGPAAVLLITTVVLAIFTVGAIHLYRGVPKPQAGRAPRQTAPRPVAEPAPQFGTGFPGVEKAQAEPWPTFAAESGNLPDTVAGGGSTGGGVGGSSTGGGVGGGSTVGGGSSRGGAGGGSSGDGGGPPGGGGGGVFSAIAGRGCPETGQAGSFANYTARSPIISVDGGFSGYGCTGGFWSVPMSGSPDTDDPGTFVEWWFAMGAARSGSCKIWTYVPQPADPGEVAGNPTNFLVLRGRTDPGVAGSFSVNQTAERFSWHFAGSFPYSNGTIAVKLLNRGVGGGGARHGAAQVLVNCRAN